MKAIRFFLLPAFLVLTQTLLAQTLPYQYSFWKEPFTPLNDATVFPFSIWNGQPVNVPLGFSFQFGEKDFSALELAPLEAGLFYNYDLNSGDTLQAIFGYFSGAGLGYKPGAQISYGTEGLAPNRIFKAEWLKVAFGTGVGDVSMQIWLYEAGNKIQIRLGPQIVPSPGSVFFNQISPLIGLGIDMISTPSDLTHISYGHWISGEAQFPGDTVLLDQETFDAPLFGCNGIPVQDAVFTFTPGNITAAPTFAATEALHFFPNPAVDNIRFTRPVSSDALIQILDIQGRMLFSRELRAGSESLQLPEGLTPGTYLIRCMEEKTVAVGTLMLH